MVLDLFMFKKFVGYLINNSYIHAAIILFVGSYIYSQCGDPQRYLSLWNLKRVIFIIVLYFSTGLDVSYSSSVVFLFFCFFFFTFSFGLEHLLRRVYLSDVRYSMWMQNLQCFDQTHFVNKFNFVYICFVISLVISFHLYTCVFVNLAMGERDSVTVDRTSKPLYLKNNNLCGSSEKHIADFNLLHEHPKKLCDWRQFTLRQIDRNFWRFLFQKYRKPSQAPHTRSWYQ